MQAPKKWLGFKRVNVSEMSMALQAKPQDLDFMAALIQGSLVQIAHAHHAAHLRN